MARRAFVDPIWTQDLFASASFENLRSVLDARQDMAVIVKSGEYRTCPCCEQTVKIYPRSINSHMIRTLVQLYEQGERKLPQHDSSQPHFWGLIKLAESEGPPAKWVVTEKGIDWLRGRITIPRYALIYNGEVYGWSREQWSVSEAAKKDFDLQEILSPFELAGDDYSLEAAE